MPTASAVMLAAINADVMYHCAPNSLDATVPASANTDSAISFKDVFVRGFRDWYQPIADCDGGLCSVIVNAGRTAGNSLFTKLSCAGANTNMNF